MVSSRSVAAGTLAKMTVVVVVALVAAMAIPARAAAAPPRIRAVTIAGNAIVGQTVRAAVNVRGIPAPELTYQWLRCTTDAATSCLSIDLATASAYVVDAGDAGHHLAVTVTAMNADGTDTRESPVTAAVASPPQLASVAITGTAIVGETLTASASTTGYPPPAVTYQWLRCALACTPIAAATAPSYTIAGADAGFSLAVRATAVNAAGANTSESLPTAAVQAPPSIRTLTIAGDAVVGETLAAAVPVTGVPAPTVTVQWLRCAAHNPDTCALIEGATSRSYEVVAADAAHRLAVRAKAVNPVGEAAGQSPPTEIVALRSGSFDQSGTTAVPASGSTATAVRGGLFFLRPFPVVRIRGRVASGGARVTLLRVRAPRGSKVVVRCRRSGCPLRRRSTHAGRIRALERFLPARIRITIRVSKPGLIGKYVRFVIRDGKPPKRHDACLLPGDSAPAECPRA